MAILTDGLAPAVAETLRSYPPKPVPLTRVSHCEDHVRAIAAENPARLLTGARHPLAALSGLMLMLGCWEASHNLSQDDSSREGSYWHAIVHRIEPDTMNSNYWFRRVGQHAIFPELRSRAASLLESSAVLDWRLKNTWDPVLFNQWCDEGRQKPGSPYESLALDIQNVECDLLFRWCAKPAAHLPKAI